MYENIWKINENQWKSMKINENQWKSRFFVVKVFPMQVLMKLMCLYALIMLCWPSFDRFWMRFDVFGAQKTGFHCRPRIDTPPLSILGKSAEGRIRTHYLGAHSILSRAFNFGTSSVPWEVKKQSARVCAPGTLARNTQCRQAGGSNMINICW